MGILQAYIGVGREGEGRWEGGKKEGEKGSVRKPR